MQDRVDRTGSEGRGAPPRSFFPVIDTESERLSSDRIFVRRTSIGYLCAGFGDASSLLRFAFEGAEGDRSRFDAACRRLDKSIAAEGLAKAERLGLDIPLGEINDPQLRRLAIAAALLKSGFDPNQARDDHGRWTDNGRSASTTGANTTTTEIGTTSVANSVAAVADGVISSPGWKIWGRAALEALPRVAAELGGPLTMAGGLILMPTNANLISEGTLPGRPDVGYKANEMELTLYHVDDQGQRTPFFVSYPDADHFYRDDQGNVVGQFISGAFVLDPAGAAVVLPAAAGDKVGEEETPEERKARIAALVAQAVAKVRTADPEELCPDPGADRAGGKSASPRAQSYQEQVTQLPFGVAFYLNGVNFDGCRYWGDGDMLEAKAEGFEQHITDDGEWKPYWKGWAGDVRQMEQQAAAAEYFGKNVEWHVAEKAHADLLEAYAESHFRNVKVVWDPPGSGRRDKRDLFVQRPDAGFVEQMRQLASPGAPRYWIGVAPSGRPILVHAPVGS